MKRLLPAVLTLALAMPCRAQTAEDSVRSTVADLFSAMLRADAAALQPLFHDSARLCTVAPSTAAAASYRCNPAAGFIAYVGSLQPGTADERARVDQVLVDGPLALAWTPYRFYAKGAFSHCGVNLIQLVRSGGRWRILSITDTRRKAPCPELR
jgi:hypothetical protein